MMWTYGAVWGLLLLLLHVTIPGMPGVHGSWVSEMKQFNSFSDPCVLNETLYGGFSTDQFSNCAVRELLIEGGTSCMFTVSPITSDRDSVRCVSIRDAAKYPVDGTYVNGFALLDATGNPYYFGYSLVDSFATHLHWKQAGYGRVHPFHLRPLERVSLSEHIDTVSSQDVLNSALKGGLRRPLRVLVMHSFTENLQIGDWMTHFIRNYDKKVFDISVLSGLGSPGCDVETPLVASHSHVHLVSCEALGISPSFLQLGASLGWMDSLGALQDELQWREARGAKGLNHSEFFAVFSGLVSYFRTFDVVLYSDTGHRQAHDVALLANAARLAQSPRLVRALTAASQFLPEHFVLPADATLAESHFTVRERWARIQLGYRNALQPVVLPPFLPPALVPRLGLGAPGVLTAVAEEARDGIRYIGYVGGGSALSSPGAFLRLVQLLVDQAVREGSGMVAGSSHLRVGGYKLRFLMVLSASAGRLEHELLGACRQVVGAGDFVHVVTAYDLDREDENEGEDSTWPKGTAAADDGSLTSCAVLGVVGRRQLQFLLGHVLTVVVDPSPSYAANAGVFPALAVLRAAVPGFCAPPLFAFASSAATEWLVRGQATLVEDTSLPAMATAILNHLGATAVVGGNCTDSNAAADRAGVAHTVQSLFASSRLLAVVENTLLAIVVGDDGVLGQVRAAEADRLVRVRATPPFPATESEEVGGHAGWTGAAEVPVSTLKDVTRAHRTWVEQAGVVGVASDAGGGVAFVEQHCTAAAGLSVTDLQDISLVRGLGTGVAVAAGANVRDESGLRVFCGVFTIAAPGYDVLLEAVLDTWGRQCDGFLAFSNVTDVLSVYTTDTNVVEGADTHANSYRHHQSVHIHTPGGEGYGNMWRKTQAILRYLHGSAWAVHFDFFLLGGDDLYVRVPSFRAYLATLPARPPEEPLYLGRSTRASAQLTYNSGGAGYVLNKPALRALVELLDESESGHGDPGCFHADQVSVEDVMVGLCLSRRQIYPLDTREWPISSSGPELPRERFHWHRPNAEFTRLDSSSLYHQYSLAPQYGPDCCATESVSFHYIYEPLLMRCLHHAWGSSSRVGRSTQT